jgi:hypothetical protein
MGDGTIVNETGVVTMDADGSIADAGWTEGVEDTMTWIGKHAGQDAHAFVDAPLLVLNADKQRPCEKRVGQGYGRWKVSANSTNRSSRRLAGVRLRELLEASGWRYDDGTEGSASDGRTVSECYSYTTLVGAKEFGYDDERPRYKRKPPRMRTAEWRPIRAEACDELIRRMERLRFSDPPLSLSSHPVTARLLNEPSPMADRPYKHTLASPHGPRRCGTATEPSAARFWAPTIRRSTSAEDGQQSLRPRARLQSPTCSSQRACRTLELEQSPLPDSARFARPRGDERCVSDSRRSRSA